MRNVYAVRPLAVLDAEGGTAGWVRADILADGTKATDTVILRDGSACDQAEAMERINADRSLMYPTRHEAVQAGLERLRGARAVGETGPMGGRRR